ncbi:hypothetical protein TTHERM_000091449 (macronuclear) [Tetrahymena thermophila SB210]|uniref:Uncharacterized protein n=1 Tax=Tetrahymena thermophila (strain SB210) TaxID=312017 RepID=W7X735_TETTS|nr:hypothetical protein TTHERM_000091449 [Tetrahymena thermophila SB210]EWS75200.1 hypothetical protein TTHERM_000091449 [Tetrahymena thermophila SB210]|eukprot:XP_012652191.1 hypothetical protein TTHERM_000091449 [Tetrahymena thermophila SB210]
MLRLMSQYIFQLNLWKSIKKKVFEEKYLLALIPTHNKQLTQFIQIITNLIYSNKLQQLYQQRCLKQLLNFLEELYVVENSITLSSLIFRCYYFGNLKKHLNFKAMVFYSYDFNYCHDSILLAKFLEKESQQHEQLKNNYKTLPYSLIK